MANKEVKKKRNPGSESSFCLKDELKGGKIFPWVIKKV